MTKRRKANETADQVVADQVRILRERRGISQQRLADELGWTQSQVARLESGRQSVSVSDLLALCWALDVAPVYLLAGSFQEGDVPIQGKLRLAPEDMEIWMRGYQPLPGGDYRAFFENIPDREWMKMFGPDGDARRQRDELAEHYERQEQLLESGATRRPGKEPDPEREEKLAPERDRRRKQLAANKRARGGGA